MFSKMTEKGVISDSSSPNIVTNCNVKDVGIIVRHPGWHTQGNHTYVHGSFASLW